MSGKRLSFFFFLCILATSLPNKRSADFTGYRIFQKSEMRHPVSSYLKSSSYCYNKAVLYYIIIIVCVRHFEIIITSKVGKIKNVMDFIEWAVPSFFDSHFYVFFLSFPLFLIEELMSQSWSRPRTIHCYSNNCDCIV